jgi:hypothetical protein
MKVKASVCLPLALSSLVMACQPAPNAPADAPAQASVTLAAQAPISADIQAFPRLVGDGEAIARINAELDRMDAAARENAASCAEQAADGPGGGFSRWITQPMTGPAYVTLREHSEWYCGGAYPAHQQTAVTYDLAAGQRIDWTAAIPGLGLTVSSLEDKPTDYVPLVSSAALGAWYSAEMLAAPDAEWVDQCRSAFDPNDLADQTFNIWADAETGGVSVQPDFAHVVQACADTATLGAEDLRGFNADPALIDALEAAHDAGAWAPDEAEETSAP